MKKLSIPILLFVFICINLNINAQEESTSVSSREQFKGFYIGGTASTNGWGGEIKYIFNKLFTIKTSFESLNYSMDYSFNESNIEYTSTVDYKTGGISLLGDYNFTRNLYLSAGVLFNSFNPKVTGYASSDLQYGDITIPASKVGDFEFTINPSLQISPYGSFGFRGFFGKLKRVVLTTEVGVYYMGSPKVSIEATGLLAPTADPAHGQKEAFENQIEQYKFFPVFKLNLAVKLF